MSINHFSVIDIDNTEIASNLTNECQKCYSKTEYQGKLIDCPIIMILKEEMVKSLTKMELYFFVVQIQKPQVNLNELKKLWIYRKGET